MVTTPYVSIVIPYYNGHEYIQRTINSVLSQDYQKLEIIVVNDFSESYSTQILENILKNYPEIKYLQQPLNSGPAVARQFGYSASSGSYIHFLDCDDTVSKNIYSELATQIEKGASDLICFWYEKRDENNNFIGIRKVELNEVNYSSFLRKNRLSFLNSLIKRETICSEFYTNLGNEDYFFWLKFFYKKKDVTLVRKPLAVKYYCSGSRGYNRFHSFIQVVRIQKLENVKNYQIFINSIFYVVNGIRENWRLFFPRLK